MKAPLIVQPTRAAPGAPIAADLPLLQPSTETHEADPLTTSVQIVPEGSYVRVADAVGTAFTNLTDPTDTNGDIQIWTPSDGRAVVRFPGGTQVRMGPLSRLTWIDGEAVVQKGSFEIEAPTLAYVVYRPSTPDPSGAYGRDAARRSLDHCQRFAQATQRSKIRLTLPEKGEAELQILEGDARSGKQLLLPGPGWGPFSRARESELSPSPMVPFHGYTIHLPVDQIQFITHSESSRAWEFEFSQSADFSDVFCRVRSFRNVIILPPFLPGQYFWRAARITTRGHRTAFSEPSAFTIAPAENYSGN